MLTVLGGCSNESSPADDDTSNGELRGSCNVRGALSGAVDETLPGTQELACGLPIGSDTGMETLFLIPGGTNGSVGSLSLRIPKLKEKETGTFDAELTVNVKDGGPRFTGTGCSVTLTENGYVKDNDDGTFVTRQYLVRGTGSCTAPLVEAKGSSVEVAPFSFVSSALWQ